MTDELTVAQLVVREGGRWPATGPEAEPRHLLEEPQPGDLLEFWADALRPRLYMPSIEVTPADEQL